MAKIKVRFIIVIKIKGKKKLKQNNQNRKLFINKSNVNDKLIILVGFIDFSIGIKYNPIDKNTCPLAYRNFKDYLEH